MARFPYFFPWLEMCPDPRQWRYLNTAFSPWCRSQRKKSRSPLPCNSSHFSGAREKDKVHPFSPFSDWWFWFRSRSRSKSRSRSRSKSRSGSKLDSVGWKVAFWWKNSSKSVGSSATSTSSSESCWLSSWTCLRSSWEEIEEGQCSENLQEARFSLAWHGWGSWFTQLFPKDSFGLSRLVGSIYFFKLNLTREKGREKKGGGKQPLFHIEQIAWRVSKRSFIRTWFRDSSQDSTNSA